MKGLIGFLKGFCTGVGLLFAAFTAIIGWCVGLYTAVSLEDKKKPKKPETRVNYNEFGRK